MNRQQLGALQSPDAVKNTTIHETRTVLFPQLNLLRLTPTGLFAEATGAMARTGAGPDGAYTEEELKSMGAPDDFPMFIQYQIAGNQDLFDANDAIRILAGFRSDTTTEPDPSFWYIDRVRTLFREMGLPAGLADNSMLTLPSVRTAVQDALTGAVQGDWPTKAGSPIALQPIAVPAHEAAFERFEREHGEGAANAGSQGRLTPRTQIFAILYHGPASQQPIDILATILGAQARGMGYAVIEPSETLYLARVENDATANMILQRLKETAYARLFDAPDIEITQSHLESATRTAGALPTLTL